MLASNRQTAADYQHTAAVTQLGPQPGTDLQSSAIEEEGGRDAKYTHTRWGHKTHAGWVRLVYMHTTRTHDMSSTLGRYIQAEGSHGEGASGQESQPDRCCQQAVLPGTKARQERLCALIAQAMGTAQGPAHESTPARTPDLPRLGPTLSTQMRPTAQAVGATCAAAEAASKLHRMLLLLIQGEHFACQQLLQGQQQVRRLGVHLQARSQHSAAKVV